MKAQSHIQQAASNKASDCNTIASNTRRGNIFSVPRLSDTPVRDARSESTFQAYSVFVMAEGCVLQPLELQSEKRVTREFDGQVGELLAGNVHLHFANGGKSQQHFGVGLEVVALLGRLP